MVYVSESKGRAISETPEWSLLQFALKYSALFLSLVHLAGSEVLLQAQAFAISAVPKEQSQACGIHWPSEQGRSCCACNPT